MNAATNLPLWNVTNIKTLEKKDTFMENIYSGNECSVSVKPDKAEKKQIRRRYFKVGLVIVFNAVMFNFVLMGILYLIGGIYGGDLSSINALKKGTQKMLSSSPDISTLVSCLIPIVSEVLSITLGCKLLKLDLGKLFNRDGYTGGTVVRTCSIGLGIQTAAALAAQIVAYILSKFNLQSATAELTVKDNSVWSVVIMYFYACLFGPLLEELLYRGVILQGLRKYNERMAIIISALIFGLMHQNYQQFILAFALGIILAAITLKSESLIPSLVTHIIVNTTGVLFNLIMQYADNDSFQKIASGDIDISSAKPAFMAAVVFNAVFRYGFMIAGIILLIMALVKGNNVRKSTPAGKSRGVPVLAQTVIWYVILLGYIYLTFVEPMTNIN
jgi:hypothetical protein